MPQQAKILVFTCSAGGAHKTAANAIQADLSRRGQYRTEILDVYDVLKPADPFWQLCGYSGADVYNEIIQKRDHSGFAWTAAASIGRYIVWLRRKRGIELLKARIRKSHPIAVMSLVPALNEAIALAILAYSDRVPFITVMLDFTEYRPGVWIQHKSQHIVCFTDEAREQALQFGILRDKIFRVSGPPLHYVVSKDEPIGNTSRLVNSRDRSVGLAVFGAQGCNRLAKYARALSGSSNAYILYACGRNKQLRSEIESSIPPAAGRAETFISDMSDYYEMAEFIITKPGALTIWEAILFWKPLVLEYNRKTLVQERFNARWVAEAGLGVLFSNTSELLEAVEIVQQESWRNRFLASVSKFADEGQPPYTEICSRVIYANSLAASPSGP